MTSPVNIHFFLDGSVHGEGTVDALDTSDVDTGKFVVTLTKPCKEFNVGDEIIVESTELTEASLFEIIAARLVFLKGTIAEFSESGAFGAPWK